MDIGSDLPPAWPGLECYVYVHTRMPTMTKTEKIGDVELVASIVFLVRAFGVGASLA
jgi:hypothetical protein